MGDEVVTEDLGNWGGNLIAFRNKVLRGRFDDRTIVKIDNTHTYCEITNRKGQTGLFKLEDLFEEVFSNN